MRRLEAGHRVGPTSDRCAFEVGLAEISLYEGRTELSVIIDDEIIILIVAVRHNRGRPIPGHQRNSNATDFISKHNGEAVKPQSITACGMHLAVVEIASHAVPVAAM